MDASADRELRFDGALLIADFMDDVNTLRRAIVPET